jgi:hypothetical protein
MLRQTDEHFKVEVLVFHTIESRIECAVITSHHVGAIKSSSVPIYPEELTCQRGLESTNSYVCHKRRFSVLISRAVVRADWPIGLRS